MPDSAFVERLNQQIAYEFAAHQQYVANAVHYDGETLPRLAAFFYAQAVDAPKTAFSGLAEPVRIALDQEKRVSDQIAELTKLARDGGDLLSEQFMQWFLKEQVEEVATMSALLKVVERSADRPMDVEEYLVREGQDGAEDPTAPPVAGGAL
jgi:bacterioferritin B